GWTLVPAVLLFSVRAFTSQLQAYDNNDSGTGSLRQAIMDNNRLGGLNTITFSSTVTGTSLLTNGELLISSYVTMEGPGPRLLAVDGNASSCVFHMSSSNNAVQAV